LKVSKELFVEEETKVLATQYSILKHKVVCNRQLH